MEVTLSIAIVAFMILPILAMMAMGTDSMRDAVEETRAVQVADSVVTELKRSSADQILLKTGGVGAAADGAEYLEGLRADNASGATIVLAFDEGGQVFDRVGLGEYEEGMKSAPVGIHSMVRLDFTRLAGEGMFEGQSGGVVAPAGIFRVDISVEHPVTASSEDRRRYPFSTMLNLTDQL